MGAAGAYKGLLGGLGLCCCRWGIWESPKAWLREEEWCGVTTAASVSWPCRDMGGGLGSRILGSGPFWIPGTAQDQPQAELRLQLGPQLFGGCSSCVCRSPKPAPWSTNAIHCRAPAREKELPSLLRGAERSSRTNSNLGMPFNF